MKVSETIKSKIKDDVLNGIKKLKIDKRTNLHFHDEILAAGDELRAIDLVVRIERETAFVFVDLAPAYNWAHPCEYHLYDAKTGKIYKKVKACLPPSKYHFDWDSSSAFHIPVKIIDTQKLRMNWKKHIQPITNAPSVFPGERYAILFSGHCNNRHTNDLEFLYRVLIDDYGFKPANIQVLNHDGTVNYYGAGSPVGNWPGDNTAYRMNVTGQGTRAGFQAAFNSLAAKIKAGDMLFIHTNNHGGGPCDGVNDYCMFVYDANQNWVPYYVNDFITDMSVLPHFDVLMVMMEQCRSGGFINPIINKSPAIWTHVATAVTANDYSLGGQFFDPFAEDWIAGIHGQYPDHTGLSQTVDTNNDGRISAIEAFNYANAVHTYDGTIVQYCPPPNGTPLKNGDTPTSLDSPAGYGAYIFLGLPAHDIYLRDNLQDHGEEPLISGGISCSPDIIVYNQQLTDPDGTLSSPAAQQSDTLGDPVEFGQDNFIYLRVQNRGSQPTSGTARLFWASPSALPTPGSWTEITDSANPFPIPSVNPQEMKIVGPIVWYKNKIPAVGHYCFIGLINSGGDPAPDPSTIHTPDDYYNFIRASNNATWKNFDVEDIYPNSITNIEFMVQGWPKIKLHADLAIDLTGLPKEMKANLKILKRVIAPALLENARPIKELANYQHFELGAGCKTFLRKMALKENEKTQAALQIIIPENTPKGNYRISVAEIINGKEMGRVTRMLAVDKYPFMGNRETHEVHMETCNLRAKISPQDKEAFKDIDRALKHGYKGCHYCLPKYSKVLV